MADLTQQQILPAPHIEAASKVYLEDLAKGIGEARNVDLTKLYGQQFVAPESALTQQARGLASGLGGYQPYLQAAQASTGPNAYQQYMSPYQQSVIDTTLGQYDIQAQKGLPGLAAQAINAGAYGGGREGVQRAEYQNQSDLNRAILQAQLQQQGYGQAQQLAQQNYSNQLGLGQATQGLLGTQMAGLTTLGAGETSQQQAQLEAQRQLAQQQAYQGLNVAERYGAGITPLIAGYPGREMTTIAPTPSPLQNVLGIGSSLAGIFAKYYGAK
jgi:Arc/MetJ-type ribon-helix-helix transcriptional regulator